VPLAEFIYSDAFQGYQFSPDHPFNPHRLLVTKDLIDTVGLLPPDMIRPPRPATVEDLSRAHAGYYIDLVARISQTGVATHGIERLGLGTEDNPVFLGMHDAAGLIVGGSLTAAEAIVGGRVRHAANLAGGLHHAGHGYASGFCIYNDLVVAIRWIREMTGWRVLYFDTDAHHGDGVQDAFYQDPNVLTVSYHESGQYLFPGTGAITELGDGPGYGYSLNVPLLPSTDDDSWLETIDLLMPEVIDRFRPDIIVSQHGCDGHYWDALADLAATTRFYAEVPRRVHAWAEQYCQGRWLATGGGGYQTLKVVPRAWTLLWAEMAHQPIPADARVPETWLTRWQPPGMGPLPDRFWDSPKDFHPIMDRERIHSTNRATVMALKERIPWLL